MLHGTIRFLAQHSVAMLEQCCNAVLREKSSLRIVSCNITFKQTRFLSDARQPEMRPFSMTLERSGGGGEVGGHRKLCLYRP